jgi:hypothetical protein
MHESKLEIRPKIPSIKTGLVTSVEERFQNDVLRPIIKLQHNLIVTYFDHYLKLKKKIISELHEAQIKDFIEQSFNRDIKLKGDFRALIIGLFTVEEFTLYLTMTTQINKRINSIIEERIKTHYLTK